MLRLAVILLAAPLAAAQPRMAGPVDNERQEEIGKLLERALSAGDPKEQIRFYKDVLRLDPSNPNAFNGIRVAQQQIEGDTNAADEREKQLRKKRADEAARAMEEERALADVDTAIQNGDQEAAQRALTAARKVGAANSTIASLEGRLRDLIGYKRTIRYAAYAAAAAAIGLLVALTLSLVGKKTAYVEIEDGCQAGQRKAIDKDVLLIGSVQDYDGGVNDIVITDGEDMISPSQCEIHRKDGRYYIVDCDSAYGTTLDGQRVTADQPVRLRHGAKIDVGGVRTLRFSLARKS